MSINDAIYNWLIADVGLNAILGDRIYPIRAPQKTNLDLPQEDCIVRAQISESEDDLLIGEVVFRRPVMAFLCCSMDYDRSHEIKEALRTAMRGLIFPSKQTVEGVHFENLVMRDCRDDARFLEVEVFAVYVEYEVHYQ